MIYITFDSNIWIYLLDDAWKEENPLDHLEHWIEQGHITILLPEIIPIEWEKHRDKEKESRKKKLKEFFNAAEEILPTSFIGDQRKPEKLEEIVEAQFQRIELLIKSKATSLPCTQETKLKIVDWGLLKQAPLHKKSSVADAVIIFSLFEFANTNTGMEFIFVSDNVEDFCEKNGGIQCIHKDLKPDFDKYQIKYYRYLNKLVHELKQKLPITIDIELRKKDRFKKKASEAVYNPELIKNFAANNDEYLKNTKHIDIILKSDNPTSQEILFIFGSIVTNESYKSYFYKNIDKPIWFSILKERGAFAYDQNPLMVKVDDGYQIPYWDVLHFLEIISIGISEGKTPELINEIIDIIKNVSEHPIDNYRTWAVFIRILKNLPNGSISNDILKFIPIWLQGKFDTMLVTIGLCESLLPKFLNDNPRVEDIEKAEIILNYLFQIEKGEKSEKENENGSYRSRLYLHFLKQTFVENKLSEKVAQYCSNDIILKLGRTIKQLLIDYPEGINAYVEDNNEQFEVRAYINEDNLQITARAKGNETWPETKQISNYIELNEDELKSSIIKLVQDFGIDYKPKDDYNDFFKRVYFAINTDLNSSFGFNTIRKLGDNYYHGEKLLEVFALIFRELLNYKVKIDSTSGRELLETICNNKNYRIPFYKRIAMFVISENWKVTKDIFFDLIKNTDEAGYFAEHKYSKDLYDLLSLTQLLLNEDEKKIINTIINKGSNGEEKDHQNFWKLRWYSALRNTEPFSEEYEKLSASENITSVTYENSGEISTRVGHVSPLTIEEIIEMPGNKIAEYIHSFKPLDNWDDPTVDGLADTIGKAAAQNPEKFSEEIDAFDAIPYIYFYHILTSLKEAIRKGSKINTDKVISFCHRYISSEDFYLDRLTLQNDGWRADSTWVVGAIANFITDCTQNDQNAIDFSFEPTLKEIIKNLVEHLKPVELKERSGMDYPTYSFNSTAGKTLRALLDYALWRARNLQIVNEIKWEREIKEQFLSTFNKNIIDGYILEGLYFSQFHFLDKDWIIDEAKERLEEEKNWEAFIAGLVFGNVHLTEEIYQILFPQYEKMLQTELDKDVTSGLIRTLTAFFFYGYEDLKTTGLTKRFIDTAKPDDVGELITFIWQQEGYYKDLTGDTKIKFEKDIKDLWEYLLQKFGLSNNDDEKEILNGIIHFIVFVPELNAEYGDLILRSCKYLSKRFVTHHFIEDLVSLKAKGLPTEVASYLAPVLLLMPFNYHVSDFETEPIKSIVRFLYENGQKPSANSFCNKISSLGNDFLKPLYEEFNS